MIRLHEQSRIYVAGHNGMVGGAIVRALRARGCDQIITRSKSELNLLDQASVTRFFEVERPELVFLAAGRVGGILANSTYRANFIYENVMIAANVIHAAYESDVTKLLNLGSSCIYPALAKQPLKEEYLLTGPLEQTNEPYAIAKITALKMCEAYRRQHDASFISVMPTNLYGPGDHFHLETSHVLPALLRKVHEAHETQMPSVEIWGSGRPRREFLYVDDLADACLFVMERYDDEMPLNVGWGEDISIRQLAELIVEVVGYEGELVYDRGKPDGTPRKLLDTTRLNALGWRPRVPLRQGIDMTYKWFLKHAAGKISAQAN